MLQWNKDFNFKIPVTVCLATIYNDNSILAVSDRMVTAGATTFEPSLPKIFPITNSIAVLTAGDQSVQQQTYSRARKRVVDEIAREPERWLPVERVAKIYSECFTEVRNEEMTRVVLSKYGFKSLSEIPHLFVSKINEEIDEFIRGFNSYNNINALIVGIDEESPIEPYAAPHIFLVDGDRVNCYDKIGFATIGIGSSHASSHLMLSSYTRSSSEAEALLTIHQAKKKSEVSPGVGKATDMCVIGPSPGSFNFLNKEILGKDIIGDMDGFYDDYVKQINKIDEKTKKKIAGYISSLHSKTETQKIADSPKTEKTEPANKG